MEIEQKQAPLIEQFVKQASTLNGPGPALVKLIVEATSHPSLFAFSEILSVPNLLQVLFFLFFIYACLFLVIK